MLEAEYATMFGAEEGHWWYRGLHDQVRKALDRCRQGKDGPLRVLDAGCGSGKVLELLARDGHAATGLDLSATALALAGRRGPFPLVRASVAALPVREAAFDVILSLDVLANLPPSAVPAALADCRRVLVPGGRLILNLVAFQSLYSDHDRAVGVVRRYRRGQVARLLAGAGFDVELLTYSNTLLFPAAALVRLWRKRERPGEVPRSDLSPLPGLLNTALARVRSFENDLMVGLGLPMPFGLSIFALARRPAGPGRPHPQPSRTRT
ncbi:Methyltransferase type 11 [Solidesulfovibrio carbinoliphilus subsp. oakridgensis]|uniref:Methyltransferase type 11 n=1 Tax=Solidesulfovibrio carbinoliphilus subsp. oakridgensis TaxID=694327 RepID=G7Q918_9BACT|nr:class I SAM-dependent methyltransferase [Solidesulfovibrio carbinoliphilus]EHJ47740.1 Methyltransferase type 11 [Solidesulfovibrio carbinoliphilus subsp. oakridgensis]